jgi:DNA-binding GntR family transcriptional regulator
VNLEFIQVSAESQNKFMAIPDSKGGRPAKQAPSIDREAGLPVYAQLADLLHQQILSGRYRPGERLPSESQLVEAFKVSPMTVRRAINLLAAQDVISTAQGRGTFVKEVELGSAAFYLSDLKELFNDDESTTIRLIEARFVSADERIARKLQIRIGERAIFIRRLLVVKDQPAFYHRGYLINDPTRPVIEAELEVTELKGIFQGSGSSLIKFGDLYLESALLTSEEAQLLDLSMPAPGMVLEHIFYDFDDKPVSWGWFVCSSERLCLHTRVGIDELSGIRDERSR